MIVNTLKQYVVFGNSSSNSATVSSVAPRKSPSYIIPYAKAPGTGSHDNLIVVELVATAFTLDGGSTSVSSPPEPEPVVAQTCSDSADSSSSTSNAVTTKQ